MRQKKWLKLAFILLLLIGGIVGAFRLLITPDFIADHVLTTQETTKTLDDSRFRFVVTSEEEYQFSELNRVLDKILDTPSPKKNLVFFVHGMGDYPEKAFDENTLKKIENEYDARVVMIHWPSWINLRTIPRANAIESGKALKDFYFALDEYWRNNAERLDGINRVLLCHSMGNEVLKGSLAVYEGGLSVDLFSTIIMAAPEVDLQGHADWVSDIDFAGSTYVMINSQDFVLKPVKRLLGKARLGLTLVHPDGRREPLANNANYIITDAATAWHRFYIERRSAALAGLFKKIINNEPGVLDLALLGKTAVVNVYNVLP